MLVTMILEADVGSQGNNSARKTLALGPPKQTIPLVNNNYFLQLPGSRKHVLFEFLAQLHSLLVSNPSCKSHPRRDRQVLHPIRRVFRLGHARIQQLLRQLPRGQWVLKNVCSRVFAGPQSFQGKRDVFQFVSWRVCLVRIVEIWHVVLDKITISASWHPIIPVDDVPVHIPTATSMCSSWKGNLHQSSMVRPDGISTSSDMSAFDRALSYCLHPHVCGRACAWEASCSSSSSPFSARYSLVSR